MTSPAVAAGPAIATGTSAALGTLAITSSGVLGISWSDYALATVLSVVGAFSYQFIKAQVAREQAAAAGKPKNELPKIDLETTLYAVIGALIAPGALISIINVSGGLHDLYSIGGFYIAGAFAPQILSLAWAVVSKSLSVIGAIAKSTGGGQP